ncbi:MAG: hypothetical protein LBQ73_04995 [Tannerellaceae bacterium]|jgi:hypothetical protein|nr:hypothetical protein [Tannerellaceae bacterium]
MIIGCVNDRYCINCRKYGTCGKPWNGYCVNHETQEEFENRIKRRSTDRLISLLEEAEGRVMLVHSGADENDQGDLDHVINLLNEVMAELKGGAA